MRVTNTSHDHQRRPMTNWPFILFLTGCIVITLAGTYWIKPW